MISNVKNINDILQKVKLDHPPDFIKIEDNAALKSKSLLAKYRNIIIIADDNTQIIAQKIFTDQKVYSLGKQVKPTFTNVKIVIDHMKDVDLLIAVGSGTINDICKYAAFSKKIDYFIYATAPSMNGYCSSTASLICEDTKKSYLTNIPNGIIFDLKIIAESPMRLIKSGLGDLLCRASVYTDWLIGSKLFQSGKFNEEYHTILKKCEKDLLDNIEHILARDISGLQKVCEVIVLQGIMMCSDNSSNPASQSEHMVAHLYNQLCGFNISHTHGEEIALTTTMMLNLQRQVLLAGKLNFNLESLDEYKDLPYLKSKFKHYKNLIIAGSLSDNLWQEVKSYIVEVISDNNKEVLEAFKRIGLPTTIKDLNWDDNKITKALNEALFYRDRYTILDLCLLTGHLKKFLELNSL